MKHVHYFGERSKTCQQSCKRPVSVHAYMFLSPLKWRAVLELSWMTQVGNKRKMLNLKLVSMTVPHNNSNFLTLYSIRLQITTVLYAYIVKYTREKILPPCRNDVPLVAFSLSNELSNHQWEVVHYPKSIAYFCYFFLQISTVNNTTAGGTDTMAWWDAV